jgi:hypothetical protein
MRTLEITLCKSVGDIILGMDRSEARQLLGDYREFSNSAVATNTFDQFSFCHLGYDADNKVEFVCIHSLNEVALSLYGNIVSDMASLELFSFVQKLDPEVELEHAGISFESNALGIAAYFEKTPVLVLTTEQEIICEKLETITVAIKGYWKKYSH